MSTEGEKLIVRLLAMIMVLEMRNQDTLNTLGDDFDGLARDVREFVKK